MDVQGKVFVVTGAGNGIGRAVALELLQRGAEVAAVDLSKDGLEETARLSGANDKITTYTLSITDRDAVGALPGAMLSNHGQVDGLVNVAGIIQPFVKIDELGYDSIERVMNVNFWGVVNMTKTFLPVLRERPVAAIVNVSSMGALAPVPGQAAYGASKAAVKLFTEALFAELQGTNVTASVVFPGAIGTNIGANSGVAMPSVAGAKGPAPTSPTVAATRIVDGIERGKFRIMIGGDVTMLDWLYRLSPRRATTMLAQRMKALIA